jgi:hypothetical protein
MPIRVSSSGLRQWKLEALEIGKNLNWHRESTESPIRILLVRYFPAQTSRYGGRCVDIPTSRPNSSFSTAYCLCSLFEPWPPLVIVLLPLFNLSQSLCRCKCWSRRINFPHFFRSTLLQVLSSWLQRWYVHLRILVFFTTHAWKHVVGVWWLLGPRRKWNWALALCFTRIRATSTLLTSMVLKCLHVFWDVSVVEMYTALW